MISWTREDDGTLVIRVPAADLSDFQLWISDERSLGIGKTFNDAMYTLLDELDRRDMT